MEGHVRKATDDRLAHGRIKNSTGETIRCGAFDRNAVAVRIGNGSLDGLGVSSESDYGTVHRGHGEAQPSFGRPRL